MKTKWKKANPKSSIVELQGFDPTKKTNITLQMAIQSFLDEDQKRSSTFHRYKYAHAKNVALKYISGDRLINTITVNDFNIVREKLQKIYKGQSGKEPSRISAIRSLIWNSIRYALTKELPEVVPSNHVSQNGSTPPKLRFTTANLDDIKNLLPVSGEKGRFASIKSEINDLIQSLPVGSGGVIQAPKSLMELKEAKSLVVAIRVMFSKMKLPWTIQYNLMKSVFLVIRRSDLEKMKNSNGGK